MSSLDKQYIDLFNRIRPRLEENSNSRMNDLREEAQTEFAKYGFPTRKTEDYRNSNIAKKFENLGTFDTEIVEVEKDARFDGMSADYFLINNRFVAKTNLQNKLPDGVFAGGINEFAQKYPNIFEAHYGRLAKFSDKGADAFNPINTMFAIDGFVLYVPDGVKIDSPIQMKNLFVSSGEKIWVATRVLIILGDNASAKLIADNENQGDDEIIATQTTEIFLGKYADFRYYGIESHDENITSINSCFISQQEGSECLTLPVIVRNGYTRNNFHVVLKERDSKASLYGLCIGDNHRYFDNFAFMDHAAPSCMSNQLFKYVLFDEAVASFCGRILVEKDSQKTLAYQQNRNLSVSKNAVIFSKPQLEIYADDVKCSHGLTTGQLDEESLFYLRARGISLPMAKIMLLQAFSQEIIDFIDDDNLRVRVEAMVVEKLATKI